MSDPNFDIDYAYGVQGELQIGTYLRWIARGNGRVEVKRKRRVDSSFYIETHCDKGRRGEFQPSGINTTKADAWAFCIGDTGIAVIVPTDLLRKIVASPWGQDIGCTEGRYPTRGKLIGLPALCYLATTGADDVMHEDLGLSPP